jgi:hypothetical protein
MSNNVWLALIFIAAILVLFGWQLRMNKAIENKIRVTLEHRGAKEISMKPLRATRNWSMYEVYFQDAEGSYHIKKCLVRMEVWDIDISWMEEDS